MLNTNTATQIKRIKVGLGISLVTLAISLTALGYVTYAWFEHKRREMVNFDEILATDNLDVTYMLYKDSVYDADNQIEFEDFYPGDVHKRTLTIVATNHDADVKMSWFFKAPTELDEIPYIDTDGDYGTAGYYNYLGSQIQIESVSVLVNSVPTATVNAAGTYLVTTNSVGLTKGQVNGVAAVPLMPDNIFIVDGLILPSGQTATIDIVFTFVDNGTNQNVFKDAWPASGVCRRSLALFLAKV